MGQVGMHVGLSEARRGGLGSSRELETRPKNSGKVQRDWMGSAERVCDSFLGSTRIFLGRSGLRS
jgi:hypothetical protein